jgi:hypothetical protein
MSGKERKDSHPYRVTVVQELQPPDMQEHWLPKKPDIMDRRWFSDKACFHLSEYVNSEYACLGCCKYSCHLQESLSPEKAAV